MAKAVGGDNVLVGRLWCSVKYEDVDFPASDMSATRRSGPTAFVQMRGTLSPGLNRQTLDAVYKARPMA
ncbi:MAG: hypothetical protein KC643_27890 [Nitrospira sp.]|nr:hypothetical protein [Nitrospira sp.]